jgi:hypothetical protein
MVRRRRSTIEARKKVHAAEIAEAAKRKAFKKTKGAEYHDEVAAPLIEYEKLARQLPGLLSKALQANLKQVAFLGLEPARANQDVCLGEMRVLAFAARILRAAGSPLHLPEAQLPFGQAALYSNDRRDARELFETSKAALLKELEKEPAS